MLAKEEVKLHYILLAAILSVLSFFWEVPISADAHVVMSITVFIGIMWLTEALPLHVTALMVPVLLIIAGVREAKEAFSPFFAPTIALFFGGFMLARAMQKHGLDKQIAAQFVGKFGRDPSKFLLGIMLITAFLSFWISNTASTAIMLPIVIFAITKSKLGKGSTTKALILGVAFAATIGGIGTIVGTPPNGIAVANLAEHGIEISFLEWMYYAMPFAIVFLPIAWFILINVYKPGKEKMQLPKKSGKVTGEQKSVLGIGALTMGLWVTSFIHGMPDAVVALIAVFLLYLFRLLETNDLSRIAWGALLLFGGGLALGAAIDGSGLSLYLSDIFAGLVGGQGYFIVLVSVIAFAVLMTLTASNTATAALLVPVMIPLAAILGVEVKELVIIAAIGTSIDFLVPIGTPPSTIAYSSGYISVKDMVKAGIPITIAGTILLAVLAWLYW
jgi:sodium-dependent dicarboxylate transporter 2/3/5